MENGPAVGSAKKLVRCTIISNNEEIWNLTVRNSELYLIRIKNKAENFAIMSQPLILRRYYCFLKV